MRGIGTTDYWLPKVTRWAGSLVPNLDPVRPIIRCPAAYLRNLLVVLSARIFPEVWQPGQYDTVCVV